MTGPPGLDDGPPQLEVNVGLDSPHEYYIVIYVP